MPNSSDRLEICIVLKCTYLRKIHLVPIESKYKLQCCYSINSSEKIVVDLIIKLKSCKHNASHKIQPDTPVLFAVQYSIQYICTCTAAKHRSEYNLFMKIDLIECYVHVSQNYVNFKTFTKMQCQLLSVLNTSRMQPFTTCIHQYYCPPNYVSKNFPTIIANNYFEPCKFFIYNS